jgi:putative endonuclease
VFYSYILKSLADGKYYFGSTNDIHKRLERHNQGKVRSTKGRRPFTLIYYEEFKTRAEAYNRELFFKSLQGKIWLKEKDILK